MSFVKTAFDIARKQVFFCYPWQPLTEIARVMHINNIGSILVRDDSGVKGIITVNGLLRQMSNNADPEKTRASDIMSSPVITASKDLEIDELAKKFHTHDVTRMVLVDSYNKVVGVVRDIAVFKYLTFFKYDESAKKTFAEDHLHMLY